ncbi:hypothetical protein [Fulvimarina manganoxydans]|uniref:hypothetical protein n=1 Tax=Fulvimarina manganoxydans TaxID=937218 RepID=UPI0023535FCC|nr:hypothetical protein [Fulvimarina manganoxydans]
MRSILIQPKAKSDLKSIGRYTLAEYGLEQAKRYTHTRSAERSSGSQRVKVGHHR